MVEGGSPCQNKLLHSCFFLLKIVTFDNWIFSALAFGGTVAYFIRQVSGMADPCRWHRCDIKLFKLLNMKTWKVFDEPEKSVKLSSYFYTLGQLSSFIFHFYFFAPFNLLNSGSKVSFHNCIGAYQISRSCFLICRPFKTHRYDQHMFVI